MNCFIKISPLFKYFMYHYENMPMLYTAIFHSCKKDNFQMKNCDVFLIFAQNFDCGYTLEPARRHSSVGRDVAWESRGTAIDPCVRHIFSLKFGHENISTAILPLPLIQEEHLSVKGERMGAEYW